jgi:hypothetical protein
MFNRLIMGFVFVNALIFGLETDPRLNNEELPSNTFAWDQIAAAVFSSELAARIIATGLAPSRFLFDAHGHIKWGHVFDVVIVIACWVPGSGNRALIFTVFRILVNEDLNREFPGRFGATTYMSSYFLAFELTE